MSQALLERKRVNQKAFQIVGVRRDKLVELCAQI